LPAWEQILRTTTISISQPDDAGPDQAADAIAMYAAMHRPSTGPALPPHTFAPQLDCDALRCPASCLDRVAADVR
jgi:hypothetical protein